MPCRLRCASVASSLALVFICGKLIDHAAAVPIVWTGPNTSFSKVGTANPTLPANQDRLTDNVWITRGGTGSGGIYNIKVESSFNKILDNSPLDTRWATIVNNPGKTITATNFADLSFTTWAMAYGGPGSALLSHILSKPAVVHLVTDDIYLNLQFTSFNSSGTFAYGRSTPAPVLIGDYNGNDVIDAADYTVWRDALSAGETSLTNDPTPGAVDESDFDYWRSHFGETLGAGAGEAASDFSELSRAAAVPEPSAALLAILAALALEKLRISRHPAP